MISKKIKKGVKKRFFEASIPLTASKVYLYHYSPENLAGSIVKIDLTKSLRGKNLELRAKIKQNGEKLEGELISLQLLSSYLKKIIYRGTDYVEDSFKVDCKDSTLRIKPLLITRNKVSRQVLKSIRNTAKKHLEGKIKIKTAEEIFSDIITNKLQKELSLKIKKIYPLAICEIRMLEVLAPIDKKSKTEN